MLAALIRRLRDRRKRRARGLGGAPRGSGWERMHDDSTYEFTRNLAESPGGQPPRVRRRRRP